MRLIGRFALLAVTPVLAHHSFEAEYWDDKTATSPGS